MGWTFCDSWTDKQALVNRLLYGDTYHKAIKHRVKGNHLWVVFNNTKPDCPEEHKRYICLFLLRSHRGEGWGYKDIEESMGPYETDCPVSFFDLVPCPEGFAVEWRDKVRAEWLKGLEHDRMIQHLEIGQRVICENRNPKRFMIASLSPLKGVADNGVIYRLRPSFITSVE